MGPTEAGYRRYLANVVADCAYLGEAGFSDLEVGRIRALLDTFLAIPVDKDAVLLHGDIGPEHVFVDADLRVSGLIDWGLWSAGAAVDDMATVIRRYEPDDVAAILVGHYGADAEDPALTRAIARSLMTKVIGYLRWMVTSGQTRSLEPGAAALRKAPTWMPADWGRRATRLRGSRNIRLRRNALRAGIPPSSG
jgi:hypothetical protein